LLDVIYRMGNCAYTDPGGSMSTTSVVVQYDVLGVHRTQAVPLSLGIWVDTPTDADCPARAARPSGD
jgi:hypothetical protein